MLISDQAKIMLWRKQLDYTQMQLSQLLGISRMTLNRYETGQVPIPKWLLLLSEGGIKPNSPAKPLSAAPTPTPQDIKAMFEHIPDFLRKP